MKKRYKFLITISVIILVLAGLVWWQFGNIRSAYYALKYSDEEIAQMSEKTFEKIDGYLKDNPNYKVRPSKPVEEKLHKDGIIDDDELEEIITEKTTVKDIFGIDMELDEKKELTSSETGEKIDKETAIQLKEENAKKEDEETEKKSNVDEEIASCIARMYVLKSSFVSQLDSLYNQAFGEYKALYHQLTPEQRDAKKKEILSRFYPRAASLEASCDAEVNVLLSRLESLLKSSGQDTSIVAKIRDSYQSEKTVKKAYYFSMLT